ncbi:MAG: acetolactate synthase large subunit [Acidimicrobiales bacterium]
MNGASSLLAALVGAGVDACFANPGTSEMHFVAALDGVPSMRGVLCLFEGVATGAADGYARIAGRPATTQLHLGPGLANGLANLHNARRAGSPVVNVVGDHATYHSRYDAPLESDIDSLARPVSGWYRRCSRAGDVGADALDALAAACGPPGRVATLVLPADVSWDETDAPVPPGPPPRPPSPVAAESVAAVAKALAGGEKAGLLLGGAALGERALRAAGRVAAATGAALWCETFPARLARGAGRTPVERLGYFGELVEAQLAGTRQLVLVGARRPVSFFAYPGKPSDLVPAGCTVLPLAGAGDDAALALEQLAEAVGAPAEAPVAAPGCPDRPSGALDAASLAAAVGSFLPEGAVVVDESNTTGIFLAQATAGCPPHDWLTLTGGAIGYGMPVATGAAVAAPGRRVLCLESDGSAMYTLQALWTQAREGLDVTTVVLANRSYAILNLELARVGAGAGGPAAAAMLDLSTPPIDFVALAAGMGVPASRATTADELVAELGRSLAEPGPWLIEAVVPGFG